MNSKLIILCIVTASCVALSAADDLDCGVQPNKEHLLYCCTIPDFFTPEIHEKCKDYNEPRPVSARSSEVSSEPASLPLRRTRKPLRHYPLSRHRPSIMSGEASRQSPADKAPDRSLCFMQCGFNETGIRRADKTLDEERMEEYLGIVFEDRPDIIAAVGEALKTCSAADAVWKDELRTLADFATYDPTICRPSYLTVWSCVSAETFKHCPASVWVDTDECIESRDWFEKCTPNNMWDRLDENETHNSDE